MPEHKKATEILPGDSFYRCVITGERWNEDWTEEAVPEVPPEVPEVPEVFEDDDGEFFVIDENGERDYDSVTQT